MIWVLFVFCLVAAFLLAGIESGLISVSRVRARHAADDGDKKAARLTRLLARRHDLLRAAMVAHQVFFVASFAILVFQCRAAFGTRGFVFALSVAPLFLLLLEMVPKNLFRLFPFRSLRVVTGPLAVVMSATVPWRFFVGSKPSTGAGTREKPQGVTSLVSELIKLDLLPQNVTTLLLSYDTFARLRAGDVMKPMSESSTLSSELPLTEAVKMAAQQGVRHHLVINEAGEVIGVLDAASLAASLSPDRLVRQFTQTLPTVREEDTALRCLQIMRKAGGALALVSNKENVPAGVITTVALIDRLLNIPGKTPGG